MDPGVTCCCCGCWRGCWRCRASVGAAGCCVRYGGAGCWLNADAGYAISVNPRLRSKSAHEMDDLGRELEGEGRFVAWESQNRPFHPNLLTQQHQAPSKFQFHPPQTTPCRACYSPASSHNTTSGISGEVGPRRPQIKYEVGWQRRMLISRLEFQVMSTTPSQDSDLPRHFDHV